MITVLPNKWKIFLVNTVAIIHEETSSASLRHVPSQSNSSYLISRGSEPTTLPKLKLWWKGPQWLSQEPSCCPTTEINTSIPNLEIINVHIACLQISEDITEKFSNLNRIIRVIAYCKRFISNCRQPKAKRQLTILSKQDFDYTQTCRVNIVKQFPYAQKIMYLFKKNKW